MNASSKTKRVVCLWFPDWPLQRLLAARPELARTVLLLTEKTRRGEFVSFCNPWACRRGIAVGMPLAEALSLVHGRDSVTVEPVQPEADRIALEELALRCEPYSPCVGLEEAASPHGLLLDITGIAHFFGGELPLIRRLQTELIANRFEARIAVGDSIGAAWAAAHYLARSAKPLLLPRGQFDLLWDLPVEGLRLGEASTEKLHRLGIRTIRQVLGLNRSSLPSRFGDGINLRLDQLLGGRSELMTSRRPLPKFQVEHFLEDGATRPEIIETWWSMLLERLVGLLQEKQLGTRHLQCAFITEEKSRHDIAVRLCEAVADARHLGDLLRLKMERLRLQSPLLGIRMEALETSLLEQPQQELFAGRPRNLARPLSSLLNRLGSRLGHQAVVRPRLLPGAVPERAYEYIPVTEKSFPATTKIHETLLPLDRPMCLFPRPRSVEVIAVVPNGPPSVLFVNHLRFDIVQSWGPERIEAGWWQGPGVRRDYYQVETTGGRRFWLFRRIEDQRWFLHGGVF